MILVRINCLGKIDILKKKRKIEKDDIITNI